MTDIPTSPAGRPMIDVSVETVRLRELERLGIALEQPDQSLQEVVDRVAQIYDVDLCTVNLILGDRQVFKAWAGDLPSEMAAMRWLDRQKGLCTYVVASHTPLVIDDMRASEEWKDQYFCAEHGVRFYAGVPLVTHHGHALGTLCLADGDPRSLSDSELERLQLFSKRVAAELQLSSAMERTRTLQAELEATARYSATLAELSVQLDEAVESGQETRVEASLRALVETAGLSWAAVAVSQEGSVWVPFAAGDVPEEIRRLDHGSARTGTSSLGDLMDGGTRPFDPARPSELAAIPLRAMATVTPTVLVAARPPDRPFWTAQDQRFLESGARLLGAALRRLQRWRDLQAEALTDSLTKLRNRRALDQLLNDPAPLGGSFKVWAGDLHGFKSLNDSMGHAVGDLCLRQVAEALLSELRPADARFLFRPGGDEFILALPLPERESPNLGKRLQEAVECLAATSYPTVDLFLDLGEAKAPEEADSLQEALNLADVRMYKAKRARRML